MKKLLFVLIIFTATTLQSFAVEKNTDKIKRVDSLIAVFDIEVTGKADKDVARPLSDSIRREIIKSNKYEVIDRSNMDKILKEQSFQMTGCTSKDCAVEAGQMLGVGKIVVGSLSMVGKMYYLSLSLVNVQTGKTEAVEEDECLCEIEGLIDSSKRAANKLMGVSVANQPKTSTVSQKTAQPEKQVQKTKSTSGKLEDTPSKSPVLAGFLGVIPGVGNYYVGSFGESGNSAWVSSRGFLYSVAYVYGISKANDHQNGIGTIIIGSFLASIIDASVSANSFNNYYQQRAKVGFDYDPKEKAGMFKLSYSF